MLVIDLRRLGRIKSEINRLTDSPQKKVWAVSIIFVMVLTLTIGGIKVFKPFVGTSTNNPGPTELAVEGTDPVNIDNNPAPEVKTVSYTVKSGDTLWVIAQANNTTVEKIIALNNLPTENLSIGQQLIIAAAPPASPAAPAEPKTATYTVKAGDTLWVIAQANNTTVDKLMALNNLQSANLSLGQQLVISGSAPASTPSSTNEKKTVQVASRSGSSTPAGTILQKAAQYLHTPYKWGGQSPGGFDCSGYVKYVYSQFGYKLPRTAADQAAAGQRVARKDLKPGDLVYFADGGYVDHIGIYVGGGKFIHSSSPRSGGVIYSSLSESYYAARYAGATRIIR